MTTPPIVEQYDAIAERRRELERLRYLERHAAELAASGQCTCDIWGDPRSCPVHRDSVRAYVVDARGNIVVDRLDDPFVGIRFVNEAPPPPQPIECGCHRLHGLLSTGCPVKAHRAMAEFLWVAVRERCGPPMTISEVIKPFTMISLGKKR